MFSPQFIHPSPRNFYTRTNPLFPALAPGPLPSKEKINHKTQESPMNKTLNPPPIRQPFLFFEQLDWANDMGHY